ncbi:MAG: SDR family oxidoreductase [Roseinatronobacter sp.]|nr:MAG: SDR family oxidoreductase [Roseinatronobacter sp.]
MTRRVILITGAARGIGRAIADVLAPDHDLAITYKTAAEDAAVFCQQHPQTLALQADLRSADPTALIASVIARFGRLDGLVNNAGLISAEPPPDAFDMALAQDILCVNALAPMALISAALPHLPRGGAIVNITSINARFPPASAPVYGASKAALENLTIGCAKALGPRGIRVNAVAPGAIERDYAPRSAEMIQRFTDETALARLAQLDEVAQAVRFLLSDAASGITGTVLPVSAGFRL